MERYKVKIYLSAQQDLRDIVDYLIFYVVSGGTVQIRRILYGRRDYRALL